jgi:hypothetical protein
VNRICGLGMLEATASFVALYDGDVVPLDEGRSRVAVEHELARNRPLAFVVADPGDADTRQRHTDLIVEHLTAW